ncbi:MAG TPA: matrixin family metalloprotease [Blastococcus sp.]|nr:matrixin family metalloprotease [Blastococcus sp.]
MDPLRGPESLPSAGVECVAEPGAQQRDIDTDDSPEFPWGHTPGEEVTVYFETGELPARYAQMVETGASTWSRSPCINALAVDRCPGESNCTRVLVEERGDDRDTDGESTGVQRDGVRVANTITLYTELLDEASDNGALATVIHEMGHALGLVHRNDSTSLMNAETDDDTSPMPDETDFANLLVIYGQQ